ncbi:membrane traffic protein [Lithospermum erythrorhizon]|uniref:Membrane traffic protein n=1 Tax=Lithospermum erythrorhizon TaxID=34254 RepID=A0AAV3QIU6_LITER
MMRCLGCGEDAIVYAICELQEEYDSRGATIIKKYMEYNRSLRSVNPEVLPNGTKMFKSGNLSKVVQDVMGYYVILEGYFMVKNVRKAIKIDEHVLDSLRTSMVDDVFYVLQSCCRRSISTSNIHSVVPIISNAVSLLGGEFNEALQQKMREPNLGAKLFMGGSALQNSGTEIATA